jgi:hypothetical protein
LNFLPLLTIIQSGRGAGHVDLILRPVWRRETVNAATFCRWHGINQTGFWHGMAWETRTSR